MAARWQRERRWFMCVWLREGAWESEVKWGEGCAAFSCLPACLPLCLSPLPASFFIYCSLLGCVNLDASGWSDSEWSPSFSLCLYLCCCCFLSLSVCLFLGLARLGYSRCCRGRQLKLWILCVISFYWCNNQIFMMTIPADNDDDKSAFSMPSIYIYIYIYIYICVLWIDFISCTLPKGEHNFLLSPLFVPFFCAFFLFLARTHFAIWGIIYWFSTI